MVRAGGRGTARPQRAGASADYAGGDRLRSVVRSDAGRRAGQPVPRSLLPHIYSSIPFDEHYRECEREAIRRILPALSTRAADVPGGRAASGAFLFALGGMAPAHASATAESPSPQVSIRSRRSRRGKRYLRYRRLSLRSLRVVSGTGPRIVENVRGLQADEAAVSTGEGECFGLSVDRLASDDMLERDPFVPPLPLPVAAEWAAHACIPALEEIEDVLHPNHARPGRCRRFPILDCTLSAGRCARSSLWASCRISPSLLAVPMGFAGAQRHS